MKILLIMDPGIPIPPPLYGGHERLLYLFAEEYHRLGHEVTLLAGPDSYCSGTTVNYGINDLERSSKQKNKELWFVWRYLIHHHRQFDVIHNFGRLAYLIPILNSGTRKIMTYGRRVTPSGIKAINRLSNKNLIFTACSDDCVNTGNVAGQWRTVYNAIDFTQYDLQEQVGQDAPLMFLGRLDKVKGVDTAIRVAKATGNKLIIGGNISHTADNYQYFITEIEPHIDGEQIIYLGPLNDEAKNELLGKAKALLFPINWDEPFGMVMVEAMACGTPVIAFNRGSVPEVINEGTTGFIVHNETEMIKRVSSIQNIDRKQCRATAKARFDVRVVAQDYLTLFNR